MPDVEIPIREEPGEYRMVAHYGEDGCFRVHGESVHPITLTVRVEDAWDRIPQDARRYSYSVEVRKDGSENVIRLEDVAPDARIFIDFAKSFDMEFR